MWGLYVKSATGDWFWIRFCPSGDACKTAAAKSNRSESQRNLGKEFLIRDPAGKDWMKSVDKGSWRMTWVYALNEGSR